MTGAYHEGMRELQDRFDTRRLADRLEELTYHQTFWDGDRTFIEAASMFFLATVDADGHPDVSYKGGVPGFVRCVDDRTLAFPSYDGNGQFRSLGNIAVNPHVSLLFVDFEHPNRMRITGRASLQEAPDGAEADALVVVECDQIWPNCPRYVHTMHLDEVSVYAPTDGHVPPEPEWKQMAFVADVLPRPKPAGD
ncbi:MAG TPA: pyridoxamine 5'-phosphate oxidase family protein [Acidimicrobiales bacterium]|nr:pyridoxamine 5'-phosphate oxidase family protein [Acidimicrobiales bacterium]